MKQVIDEIQKTEKIAKQIVEKAEKERAAEVHKAEFEAEKSLKTERQAWNEKIENLKTSEAVALKNLAKTEFEAFEANNAKVIAVAEKNLEKATEKAFQDLLQLKF